MINTFVGNLGHFAVILSFVSALVTAFSYYKYTVSTELDKSSWRNFSRISFYVHAAASITIAISLFEIIYQHRFEYFYAYSHSSKALPVHYMISSFWEGQEGAFILWIFWNVVLGLILIKTNKFWEGPVMIVFALVQAFLVSMIMGVVIGDLKIGSSPFVLLRDVMSAPIFQINPEFVPEDGTGLNPLLQNIWMVIHPPTLFLGYASTLVPFAFLIGGLVTKKYSEWIRPALPWAIFSAMILGMGIIMGAYWAYVTLNFGGYWNWDPVENAVYVPWLIMIAAIHTMITFKKSSTALKTSIVLVIASFILVLYATFLVRSGVLGDSSVHSFTDLGLSGQLLIYMLFFLFAAVFLAARAWKHIPTSEKEASVYSREFWIFIGATTLGLMAFQVILPTSIPVWNAIVEIFGGISNMAPPTDQVGFYTKFQLWFAVALAMLSAVGQFFWWDKIDGKALREALVVPYVVSVLISAAIIVLGKVYDLTYIVVVLAGTFTIVANSTILFRILKKSSVKLAGGSLAHIGLGMILIGVMFSSGYSEIISYNMSGLTYSNSWEDEMNKEHVLLWINKPTQIKDYTAIYRGRQKKVVGVPGYVDVKLLESTGKVNESIALNDIVVKEKTYFKKGDIVPIVLEENDYFQIDYYKEDQFQFSLNPMSQFNTTMGLISSPDSRRFINKDLYTFVAAINDFDEPEWRDDETYEVTPGETFYISDFVTTFEGGEVLTSIDGLSLEEGDVAVKAKLVVMDYDVEKRIEPIFIIRDSQVGRIPVIEKELGVKVELTNIVPEENKFVFTVNRYQKDYVVLKAIVKPQINILWVGTIIMLIGFSIAIFRRFDEFAKMRDKGLES
ncbi:cytochrome C biogenesis protein [Rhodonellum psychrophilum GCM71 = DSM 17998]|uniref:Cytochrome C biogenesis protein n=2 Tax=Rhodonellum TaxID=336827 RepID=U5BTA0_9BACT|nr:MULTISPECIES: cytochrome c biogenesis protein CcsA [Rhodonellum]ERM80759.1 cytochrome C biogenesis protein [Rhodonellum psychrophilum GCM71 = DSM 17998]SDZ44620.1 cytochrome c-type biogenesis protein CcmF [Rhodonellum ikkaensis]